MKVFWTLEAEGHLDAIYAHIARNSPVYALRMVDKITRCSIQIADFPLSGRRVPEFDADQIREIIEAPYRIIYHVKPNRIDVLSVIHSAREIEV